MTRPEQPAGTMDCKHRKSMTWSVRIPTSTKEWHWGFLRWCRVCGRVETEGYGANPEAGDARVARLEEALRRIEFMGGGASSIAYTHRQIADVASAALEETT